MKAKNRFFLILILLGSANFALFQNCSKVNAKDVTQNKAIPDSVAVATDGNGDLVPVTVGQPGDLTNPPPDSPPSMPPTVSNDPPSVPPTTPPSTPTPTPDPSSGNTSEPTPDVPGPVVPPVDMAAVCGLNLQTIHNVVDLAQFDGQDVNLDLIQGKTLLYSSNPDITLKSLSIDAAVGRTILCGVHINTLNVKKGRLECYHSQIDQMGQRNGKLITDAECKLPAGT